MARTRFYVYTDYKPMFDKLTDAQCGKLLRAMLADEAGAQLPALDDVAAMAWTVISARMERDREQYEAICERNRANGQQGGRPPSVKEAEKETQSVRLAPSRPQTNPTEPDMNRVELSRVELNRVELTRKNRVILKDDDDDSRSRAHAHTDAHTRTGARTHTHTRAHEEAADNEAAIRAAWSEAFGKPPNKTQLQRLMTKLALYDLSLIREAIDKAAAAGANNPTAYITQTLTDWHRRNITNDTELAQAEYERDRSLLRTI